MTEHDAYQMAVPMIGFGQKDIFWYFARRWCCPHSMLFCSYSHEYDVEWWNVSTGYCVNVSTLDPVLEQVKGKSLQSNMFLIWLSYLFVYCVIQCTWNICWQIFISVIWHKCRYVALILKGIIHHIVQL